MTGFRRFALLSICALPYVPHGAGAAVITMGTGGTYATLAAAVGAASPGDTILVEPGTYTVWVGDSSQASLTAKFVLRAEPAGAR